MHIVVLITTKNIEEANTIVSQLIKNKEIDCANIVSSVNSLFWWKGNVEKEEEVLIIAKSQKSQFKAIEKTVKLIHSYTVPEIIAIPIVEGSEDYLKWIDDSVETTKKK